MMRLTGEISELWKKSHELEDGYGYYYAAQYICDGYVIPHSFVKEELPSLAAVAGKKVQISCRDCKIGEIREEFFQPERSRGWSR